MQWTEKKNIKIIFENIFYLVLKAVLNSNSSVIVSITARLTLQRLVLTKGSYILKQTCSSKLQICLSMYDFFVDTKGWRVKQIWDFVRLINFSALQKALKTSFCQVDNKNLREMSRVSSKLTTEESKQLLCFAFSSFLLYISVLV